MAEAATESVTQLLAAWSEGSQEALDRLVPLVHDELHRLARRYMRGERAGHTLQTTALVNEAYLRLVDQPHTAVIRERHVGIVVPHRRQTDRLTRREFGLRRRDAPHGLGVGVGILALNRHAVRLAVAQHPILAFPIAVDVRARPLSCASPPT